ncbi:hypothetical protein K4K48_011830 [Colletotrichum sp. SAR 10_66]|nr:hypothetical protein K4K51_004143 [Colletotrichum sp. SAR 10_75]KAJ5003459.1 hypothetical protein K4K48_011830 [Colletotrichum sp. SAR 10_66]
MTMDRTAKFKSKLKFGSEDQMTGALSSLDDSISDFQMELDICAQFRMGRMHETMNANGAKLSIIEKVVKGLSQDLNEGNDKAVTKQTIEEHVCNALHRFYASNPHFNPVNGGQVRIPEQNNKIVEEWYESLQDFDPSPEKHVTDLNGQLLKHVLQKRPGVDLSLLQQENKRLMKKSTQKPKYAVKLFRGLLELLEDDDVVFIILDSWSRLLGDRMEADKVIEKLSQNTKDASHLTIKILVLDPLPSDSIHESAHSVLYVPDEIDGWKNDVSLSLLKASNERMVEDLKDVRNRKRELNESDSETSDQDW